MSKDHLHINQSANSQKFWMWTSQNMGKNLPYVFFLIFLAMVYIGNAHYTEKKVRKIEMLKTEIKELTWIYMSAKSDALYQSTYSELSEQVKSNQLSNSGSFPKKLSPSP
jgi:hypothetical protein